MTYEISVRICRTIIQFIIMCKELTYTSGLESSSFVVSFSTGNFHRTMAFRTFSPSAAAKIFPFKRAVDVAAPNPDASWVAFESIILHRFPRPPSRTRQQSILALVHHRLDYKQ
jgi:hypothetical protein